MARRVLYPAVGGVDADRGDGPLAWQVPDGVITEEMLSAHDWYKTFAALAGASDKVPTDRPMDGFDASSFLLGKSEKTGRETLLFFGPDGSLMSSKWRQVKVVMRYCDGISQPILQPQFPMFFDLGGDPGERYNLFESSSTWAGCSKLPSMRSRRTATASWSTRTYNRGRNSTATRHRPRRRKTADRYYAKATLPGQAATIPDRADHSHRVGS